MNLEDESKELLPLLVGFSVRRTGDDTLPGHYDTEQQVWVVNGSQGVRPIIETAGDLCELVTKTSTVPERDDVGSTSILEATTKTEARPERDDVAERSFVGLLELATKTKVQLERDDS